MTKTIKDLGIREIQQGLGDVVEDIPVKKVKVSNSLEKCWECGMWFKEGAGMVSHIRARHPELVKKEPRSDKELWKEKMKNFRKAVDVEAFESLDEQGKEDYVMHLVHKPRHLEILAFLQKKSSNFYINKRAELIKAHKEAELQFQKNLNPIYTKYVEEANEINSRPEVKAYIKKAKKNKIKLLKCPDCIGGITLIGDLPEGLAYVKCINCYTTFSRDALLSNLR